MSFRLEVSADVKKTEDPEKVKISITNIFPDINIEKNKDIVIGYSEIRKCPFKVHRINTF